MVCLVFFIHFHYRMEYENKEQHFFVHFLAFSIEYALSNILMLVRQFFFNSIGSKYKKNEHRT